MSSRGKTAFFCETVIECYSVWKIIYMSPAAVGCEICVNRINFLRGVLMEIYLKYVVKLIENEYIPKSVSKYLGGLVIPFFLFNLYVFSELISNIVPSIHSEFFLRVKTFFYNNKNF